MKLRLFQVDAFTSRVFSGNPAAVVPLPEWLPDDILQAIALENNLAETAYFIPSADKSRTDFDLRWFTPAVEMDLCGHATLASGHVLYEHLGWQVPTVRFDSRSGPLEVTRDEERLTLDFPARPGEPVEVTDAMRAIAMCDVVEARLARDLMLVLENEDAVLAVKPDVPAIEALSVHAVIITAPGHAADVDFVSRFFAPEVGVLEDPVTGSAHCTLIPYWAKRLGKSELFARQVSARGGELYCEHHADRGRVSIGGRAVTYLEGEIRL